MAGNSVRMLYARVDMYDLFHCARQLEVFRPDWIERSNEGTSPGKYNSSDCVITTDPLTQDYKYSGIEFKIVPPQ